MQTDTMLCPHCQTPNPVRNSYCQACGKPMTPTAAAPVVSPPPTISAPPYSSTPAPGAQPVGAPPPVAPGYPPQGLPPAPPPQTYPVQGPPPQGYQPPPPPPPQGNYPGQGLPPQNYPPQAAAPQYPPAGMPPPQQPYPQPSPVAAIASLLDPLGARSEGWNELVADQANKALEVNETFAAEFNRHEIAGVTLQQAELAFGKDCQMIRGPFGSVTVVIRPFGRDLNVGWSLFPRREPNWKMIGVLGGVAMALSMLSSLSGFIYFYWIMGTLNWLMPVAILAVIAGYLWKGTPGYFFITSFGETGRSELAALTRVVQRSLQTALEKAGVEGNPKE